MSILRVFPRKTTATPDDKWVRIGPPAVQLSLFDNQYEANEIRISVTFTWDKPVAEKLAEQWRKINSNISVGGVAYGDPGGEFEPGMYLKHGHVITSRGCPNKCWFCDVPKREGGVRELEVKDGWIVQDSNLLATSRAHQEKVFRMLQRQPEKPRFNGGLEAAILTDWHCEWLAKLKPNTMWFAYDTPNDYEPLVYAGRMLREHGVIKNHNAFCYVLIGYKGDTMEKAEKRLIDTIKAGFTPQAMLYNKIEDKAWRKFQREWANRIIVFSKINEMKKPR